MVNGFLDNVNIKVADFDVVTNIKETITATSTVNKFDIGICFSGNLLAKGKSPSTITDIYAWGISAYEISSNVSSPWENVLPNLSDAMLLTAIAEDKRPSIEDVQPL